MEIAVKEKKPPLTFRVPEDVNKWVEDEAKRLDRSKSYVVVSVLRRAIENSKPFPRRPIDELTMKGLRP